MNLSLGFPDPSSSGRKVSSPRKTDLASAVERLEQWMAAADSPIRAIRHLPAREGQFVPLPAELPNRLCEVLKQRGVGQLYTHQAEAYARVRQGRNVVVVTPTASGKTLCYNLPVLTRLAEDPELRAIYLFPTKALAMDQLHEFHEVVEAMGSGIRAFTYDGDTPQDARKAIRERANVVLTNPDMLHTGILPHHTRWAKLFENLQLHRHRRAALLSAASMAATWRMLSAA